MAGRRPKLTIRKDTTAVDVSLERDIKPTRVGGLAEEPLSEEDERRERDAFGRGTRRRVDPPEWFLDLARRRATPAEVIETLISRIPEMENLDQARSIVNEIGRLNDGGEAISRAFTPEVMRRLHSRPE